MKDEWMLDQLVMGQSHMRNAGALTTSSCWERGGGGVGISVRIFAALGCSLGLESFVSAPD